MSSELSDLFRGLFDDASMFPPQDEPAAPAVAGHLAHRMSWYADMVGRFVCVAGQLTRVDAMAASLGVDRLDVAMVVPDGLDALHQALHRAAGCPRLRVDAVEVPLAHHRLADALRHLEPLVDDDRRVYLEIGVPAVDEHRVHEIAPTGIRLKLRTGGTAIEPFQSEDRLARPLVLCAAERLAFKCTAGLHHAVRLRDTATLFEHHGFLNIALAARIAAATGSHAATRAALGERDPRLLVHRIGDMDTPDIVATRALFDSFGTCRVDEPIADLLGMGLVSVP